MTRPSLPRYPLSPDSTLWARLDPGDVLDREKFSCIYWTSTANRDSNPRAVSWYPLQHDEYGKPVSDFPDRAFCFENGQFLAWKDAGYALEKQGLQYLQSIYGSVDLSLDYEIVPPSEHSNQPEDRQQWLATNGWQTCTTYTAKGEQMCFRRRPKRRAIRNNDPTQDLV